MNKIIEFVVEPNKIFTGSTFLLKIKAIRHLSYEEVKSENYNYFKNHTYRDVKGV